MTKIFTFPCDRAALADTPEEAAERLAETYDEPFDPAQATLSEEPGDEEFEARYGKPVQHGQTITGNPETLETYGPELEKVQAAQAATPKNVWTIVDCDDGISRLTAGFHWVNAINYLLTLKPWQSEEESYVWG